MKSDDYNQAANTQKDNVNMANQTSGVQQTDQAPTQPSPPETQPSEPVSAGTSSPTAGSTEPQSTLINPQESANIPPASVEPKLGDIDSSASTRTQLSPSAQPSVEPVQDQPHSTPTPQVPQQETDASKSSYFPNNTAPVPSAFGNQTQTSSEQQTQNAPQQFQQPAAFQPPIQAPGDDQQVQSVTPPAPKRSIFKTFVIILIVIAIIVYAVVGYLYFTIRDGGETTQTLNQVGTALTSPPSPTPPPPTPAVSVSEQISIISGNIVRQNESNENIVLVNKNDYPGSGIIGFYDVVISPDETGMCFYTIAPSTSPMMYYSDINANEILEVDSNASDCIWTGDSRVFYYVKKYPNLSFTNILNFTPETATSQGITNQSADDEVSDRTYSLTGLSDDGSRLLCSYRTKSEDDIGMDENFDCEIDLATGQVSDI